VPDLGIPYLAQTLGVIVSARAGWLSVFFAGLLLTMVIMRAYICSLPFEILPVVQTSCLHCCHRVLRRSAGS
jgi:hypothetical protein